MYIWSNNKQTHFSPLWSSCDHGQNSERYQHLQCSHIERRLWLWVPATGLLVQSSVKVAGWGQMWARFLHTGHWWVRSSDAERVRVPLKFFMRLERLPAAAQYLLCWCQRLCNVHWQPGPWDSILVWKHKLDSHVVYNVVYTTWLWLTQLSVSNFTVTVKLEAFSYRELLFSVTIGGTNFICHRKIELKWKYQCKTTKIRTL